jgi:hypothetical protein
MPVGLDKLRKEIWGNLKGKINPRTKKPYTESESWAIATAQWKKSGRQLSVSLDENYEPEEDLVENAIKQIEEGE